MGIPWAKYNGASSAWVKIIACLLALFCVIAALPARAENANVTIGVGDTVLVVSGRTSPNAFVTILDSGSTIGTTAANALGDFTKTFTGYKPGLRQMGVYARDTQNRITTTVTKEVNVQEHFQTTVSFFVPTTLEIDNSTVIQGEPIPISGSTIPNGEVLIILDDNSLATVVANAGGDWQYTVTTADLAPGTHSIYAKVTDTLTAEQGYPTAKTSIIIIAPSAIALLPPFAEPAKAPAPPTITYPSNGTTVDGTELTVRGTAEPNTLIRLYNGSRTIGSSFADSAGNWEIVIALSEPSYSIRARACRSLACSDFSQTITFFWNSPLKLGTGLSMRLERYWFLLFRGRTVTNNIQIDGGVTPYSLTIDWGDGSEERIQVKSHTVSLQHRYDQAGHFTGHVRVKDKEGRTTAATFASEVLEINGNYLFLLPIFLFLLLVFMFIFWLLLRRHKRRKKRNKKNTAT